MRRGLQRFASLTSLAGAVLCWAAPAGAQVPADDRAQVLAVVDTALAAISRKDFVALTDLMLDSAVVFSAGVQDGQVRVGFRTRAQERATTPEGTWTERGFDPQVMISGPLATVWLPYDFYLDGAWSHCGVDVFILLKVEAGWRIATVAYSVEQPPACQKHPNAPPAK